MSFDDTDPLKVVYSTLDPLNQISREFNWNFRGNQTERKERFDTNNISFWYLPCCEQNKLLGHCGQVEEQRVSLELSKTIVST